MLYHTFGTRPTAVVSLRDSFAAKVYAIWFLRPPMGFGCFIKPLVCCVVPSARNALLPCRGLPGATEVVSLRDSFAARGVWLPLALSRRDIPSVEKGSLQEPRAVRYATH